MNVTGLSSNFYLSDNPIYLNITNISPEALYVEVYITRLTQAGTTDIVSKPQKLYNLQTSLSLDIAPLIKSFIPEPKHNTDYNDLNEIPFYGNSIQARVTVNEVTGVNSNIQSFTKYFIRGGKRTYASNQNVSVGQNLIPANLIPTWPGYPSDYYFVSSTGVTKSNVIPEGIRENRSIKGCDPLYVKFLNSLGGYSYWLFENWEEEESNKNLGEIQRQNDILDLGNDYDERIELISKVPARFMLILKDLIVSKEIYLWNPDTQEWSRISSDNNKITTNPYSVNTKVKLKFKPFTRYNPALTW